MRIAHYCNVFSKLSETFIYDVITELQNQHVDNIVFANKLENQQDRPFSDVIAVTPKPVGFISKKVNAVFVKLGLRKRDYLKVSQREQALHALFEKYKPDVVHCHFGPQGCIAMPVTTSLHIPLVVSFHGFDAFKLPNTASWMQQYTQLFQQAAAITVVSELMKKQLISLGCSSTKLHVIHVGKRTADYAIKPGHSKSIRKFLSIGRMEEKKGHLDTIRVFSKVAATYPDVRLTIIGTGSMLEQAQELVAQLQLQNVVRITGGLPHEAVKKELQEADAFILCSKTASDGDKEGVPTVLMEAQAVGLPCVSTKHSGIPEVIPQENQWLLGEEGDVEGLAAIVERLINTPETQLEQLIERGREKIDQEFRLEVETAKLQELYKGLVD